MNVSAEFTVKAPRERVLAIWRAPLSCVLPNPAESPCGRDNTFDIRFRSADGRTYDSPGWAGLRTLMMSGPPVHFPPINILT
jgi:hypothetical protein